jgi:D-inositol-3-phosphate glycosyltransferase
VLSRWLKLERDAGTPPVARPLVHRNDFDHVLVELLQHMPEFARATELFMRNSVPYDVVHAHFFMSSLVARRMQERFGTPFVMTFHALGLVRMQHQRGADTFPSERIDIERELVRYADALIPECPQDRADLVRLYGADPERMTTIPCGFDPLEFSPMKRSVARAALGLSTSDFIALQLGRIVPRKGIDNVIRSLAELPRDIPARLLVVGGSDATPDETRTPELHRLRLVAEAVGVADRVTRSRSVFDGSAAQPSLRIPRARPASGAPNRHRALGRFT